MSANTTPIFTKTPNIGFGNVATADSAYTGTPTNKATVFTAATDGSLVTRVTAHGAATSAAAIVRLFLFDGSTYTLYEEILVPAATGSATVAQFDVASAKITPQTPLALKTGWTIVATTSVSQSTNVICEGGDF